MMSYEVKALQAELAEARAQIAAIKDTNQKQYDEGYAHGLSSRLGPSSEYVAELRAQIATFKELYAKEGHAKMVILEELSEARAQIAAKEWTEHQKAKYGDFLACLDEYEGMRCESTTRRVREAAFDFALSFALASPARETE